MNATVATLKRHSGLAAATLALAMLQGCANPKVLEDWYPAPTHAPLPAKLVQISDRDLPARCNLQGLKVYGCSFRVPAQQVCVIYTGPNPPQWLVEHEKKHCDGWEHSDPRTAAGVVRVSAAVEKDHSH